MADMTYMVIVYLHGDHLVPEVVTKSLGAEPTKAWRKGQQRDIKTRTIKTKIGLWKLKIEVESSKLDDYISVLFQKIQSRAIENVFEIPGVEYAKLDVFYLAEPSKLNHRMQISAGNLKRLANLGLTLNFTLGLLSDDDDKPEEFAPDE
jgi:Domain of unknown function (DUF4279)